MTEPNDSSAFVSITNSLSFSKSNLRLTNKKGTRKSALGIPNQWGCTKERRTRHHLIFQITCKQKGVVETGNDTVNKCEKLTTLPQFRGYAVEGSIQQLLASLNKHTVKDDCRKHTSKDMSCEQSLSRQLEGDEYTVTTRCDQSSSAGSDLKSDLLSSFDSQFMDQSLHNCFDIVQLDDTLDKEQPLVIFPLTHEAHKGAIRAFNNRHCEKRQQIDSTENVLDQASIFFKELWSLLSPSLWYFSERDIEDVWHTLKSIVSSENRLTEKYFYPSLVKGIEIAIILSSLQVDKACILTSLLVGLNEKDVNICLDICPITSLKSTVMNLLSEYFWIGKLPSFLVGIHENRGKLIRQQIWSSVSDHRTVLLKLAERLWTIRNLHKYSYEIQQSIALEVLQVFVPLANASGLASYMWELSDRCLRILFPTSYLQLEKWHMSIWNRAQAVLASAERQLLTVLQKDTFLFQVAERYIIQGRTKNLVSTFMKMLKRSKRKEQIFDFIAMRVIVCLRPDIKLKKGVDIESAICKKIYQVVTCMWEEYEGRHKDYVAAPKANGYRSIHTTVKHSSGFPVEIQIRTEEMHLLAEYGSASHRLYKGEVEPDTDKRLV